VQQLAAPCGRAIIKVLLTRGAAAARGYAVTGLEKPTRISLRYAWPPEDPGVAREGVRVRIAALRLGENPALAGLKHCNRLEQVWHAGSGPKPGLLRRSCSAALEPSSRAP